MIALILLMFGVSGIIAETSDPSHTMCTSVGGPIQLGTKDVTVGLKCCPAGSFISDLEHPVDAKGNLICYREKT